MADARLRELKRWQQADLETRARLLRERMRVWELPEDRVRLAAYCGNAPSAVALGDRSRQLENHTGAFATEHALRAAARRDSTELQGAKSAMGAAGDAAKAFNSVFHGDMARKVSFRADFRHDPQREEAVRSALPSRSDLLLTIQSDLVPWALGLRDPIAERVAAREASQ